MIDTELNEFVNKMLEVLIEKQEKYKDTWKTCDFLRLKGQLFNRANELGITSKSTKRKLIHIANYCYFLYTRLENI